MMAPTADLSDVAAAGKAVKSSGINQLTSQGGEVYLGALGGALFQNVGTGGKFDYQRVGPQYDILTGGFQQLPQFRDVSNFNVGLFAQQAGLSLDDTLRIAGGYASIMSSNSDANHPYGLSDQTAQFIILGYETGAGGIYDK